MGFFYKLRDMKDTISYKMEDVKDFVVEKAVDARDLVSDKAFDAKYAIEDKVSDLKDFVEDTAYFVSEKAEDTKDFILDKAADTKDFVSDKTFDAKYYISEKIQNKSRADLVEIGSYVLFPAQIPLKAVMSAVGKNSAYGVQEKSDYLNMRIDILEKQQDQGKNLNEKLTAQFEDIRKVKEQLHTQLEYFAEVFEKIHNRPTYNIKFDGHERTFDELFRHANIDSDFAMFDSYLLKIYDEDAGIIDGLMRSPVFAAILKFRERALKNKIDHAVSEVNQCIENMKVVNDYLASLSSTAAVLAKELHAIEEVFWDFLYELSETVDNKPDFERFTEDEITLLDTNIKLVRVIVALLNTHLFEETAPDANGLKPINQLGVERVAKESEGTLGDMGTVLVSQ
ncbi:hypothetical protein AB5I83_08505 [Mesobacillus sp. LC4]